MNSDRQTGFPVRPTQIVVPDRPPTDPAPVAEPESDCAAKQAEVMDRPRDGGYRVARDLAADGWACFPCLGSKAPACPGGFKSAVSDPDLIVDLFGRHPAPLIGVATGAVSGVDVLDLDARHGAATWWAEMRNQLPDTRTHRTRSGGLHLFFRHAADLRNSASRLAPGCDVRADGGYVIWWPAAGLPVLSAAPAAPWPDQLLWQLRPAPQPPRIPAFPASTLAEEAGRRYALAALRRAVQHIATADPGRRNSTLNTECFGLCRFVPVMALAPSEIAHALAEAARHVGLTSTETQRTIASALRAGGVQ